MRDTYPSSYTQNGILHRVPSHSGNPDHYLGKYPLINRNLHHLKGNISTVFYNLRSDLDQFPEEAAERPVCNFLWKHQTAERVTQIVSQSEEPAPYLIRNEMLSP